MIKLSKNIITAFLSVCLIVPSMAFFTACSQVEPEVADALLYALTTTMEEPVGMIGFEDEHELPPNDEEMVEIIVQFSTPSARALEILRENGLTRRDLPQGNNFEAQALAAHTSFQNNLERLDLPPSVREIEILGTMHLVSNGMYLRLPASLVPQIAALPGVFSVEPHIIPEVPNINPDYAPANVNPAPAESVGALPSSFFVDPTRMEPTTRAFLQMNELHAMGFTGRGVTAAIIDTGVCPEHQEMQRFLDSTGRVRGWEHHERPGGTWDWEWYDCDGHGTLTAGSLIAMAPEVTLYSFRRSYGGMNPDRPGMPWGTAFDAAVAVGADVIYSWGGGPSDPFTATAVAVTVATLAGHVVAIAAHNQGPNPHTIWQQLSPLAINVASGTAGSDSGGPTNIMANSSGRGPVMETWHIKPDITAPGVLGWSTTLNNDYRLWSGTSRAGPVLTGIAAVVIQAFPYAEPWEIKARLMSATNPVTGTAGDNVFAAGAGLVSPMDAVTQEAFATVIHPVPMSENRDTPFVDQFMASLSFGPVAMGTIASPTYIVNIHNAGSGTWTHSVQFNGESGGGHLSVNRIDDNVFAVRMQFSGAPANRLYQGVLTFENDGQQIRIPFAAAHAMSDHLTSW